MNIIILCVYLTPSHEPSFFGAVWKGALLKLPPHLHCHHGHHCFTLPGEDTAMKLHTLQKTMAVYVLEITDIFNDGRLFQGIEYVLCLLVCTRC